MQSNNTPIAPNHCDQGIVTGEEEAVNHNSSAEPLTDEGLLSIQHASQERVEDLCWLAACQDLTQKQAKELADCKEEVEAINRELRKTAEQRAAEHRVRVREAEQQASHSG